MLDEPLDRLITTSRYRGSDYKATCQIRCPVPGYLVVSPRRAFRGFLRVSHIVVEQERASSTCSTCFFHTMARTSNLDIRDQIILSSSRPGKTNSSSQMREGTLTQTPTSRKEHYEGSHRTILRHLVEGGRSSQNAATNLRYQLSIPSTEPQCPGTHIGK